MTGIAPFCINSFLSPLCRLLLGGVWHPFDGALPPPTPSLPLLEKEVILLRRQLSVRLCYFNNTNTPESVKYEC